jgi:hypothetical protein
MGRLFRLVVGLVAVGGLAACSGSLTPSTAGLPPEASVSSPPPVSEVAAHLLTINELPAGWRAEPVRGKRQSDGRLCNAGEPPAAETELIAVFDRASGSGQIAENLYGFASSTDAAAAYAFEVSHATCSSYTAPDGVITVTLARLSLPSVGQKSMAWRVTIMENRVGIRTSGDVMLVLDGSYNVGLIERSRAGVDPTLMQITLHEALADLSS